MYKVFLLERGGGSLRYLPPSAQAPAASWQVSDSLALPVAAIVTLQLAGQSRGTARPGMKGSTLFKAEMCRGKAVRKHVSSYRCPAQPHQPGAAGVVVETRSVCKVRKRVRNTDFHGDLTASCDSRALSRIASCCNPNGSVEPRAWSANPDPSAPHSDWTGTWGSLRAACWSTEGGYEGSLHTAGYWTCP